MATPHVTGAIALYLQTNPGASPATVTQALISNSTLNHVTNAGTGSPNRLLYSIFGGAAATTRRRLRRHRRLLRRHRHRRPN